MVSVSHDQKDSKMVGKLASSIVQLLIVSYMQQVGGAGHWIFRPIGLVLWRKFWAGHQNLESAWLGKKIRHP